MITASRINFLGALIMIRLSWVEPSNIGDVRQLVQQAIDLEFATLPPYLYANLSIPRGKNSEAKALLTSIQGEEMVHMCLACNIMNAIGGDPKINPPSFPGPLPGDIGGGFTVHLYPFSKNAMQQGMHIEEPADPFDPPEAPQITLEAYDLSDVTIGEFYQHLERVLSELPKDEWHSGRHQVWDNQFMQGMIFKINNFDDAKKAIDIIVSEGEGTSATNPLDQDHQLAHYYRFEEIYRDRILTLAPGTPDGYVWGDPLGVDWHAVFPAISDPETHDFSNEPETAQRAQQACNQAFTDMVDELQLAFTGQTGHLGNAIGAMLGLQKAALMAFKTPLNDNRVAGPAFKYINKA